MWLAMNESATRRRPSASSCRGRFRPWPPLFCPRVPRASPACFAH